MKNRTRESRNGGRSNQGFDKVTINNGTPEGLEVNDISRFNRNSEARYRQDVVMEVSNNFPAAHVVGKLTNGVYVAGAVLEESIVREATIVVLEPYDKPVVISVGTASNPKKFVVDFDATQARGTIVITKDCNTFIDGNIDDIIVTVAGADDGLAGRLAVILEVSKLGASTLMPSN